MKPSKIVIVFQDEALKDEFLGWLSDGGGEQSFNLNDHIADFTYYGSNKVVVTRPV